MPGELSGKVPRLHPHPGWAQVAGQHPGRLFPSSGRKRLFWHQTPRFRSVHSSLPRGHWMLKVPGSRPGCRAKGHQLSGAESGAPGPALWKRSCCRTSRRWGRSALRRRVRSPPRSPQVQGPRPLLPPAARLQDTQKGALPAEVGVRPLGYSSTKQRALTDRAPPPAEPGPGGDRQVRAAHPDL